MPKLLTRDDFRAAVFARDDHRCVFCRGPARDAHHILERRLFDDGGYYLDNGVSVCAAHHLECEQTTLGADACREAAGIAAVLLPAHLVREQSYDKWGDPILGDGRRLRGELFWEEPVQRALRAGGVLDRFTDGVMLPRPMLLPWSPAATDDARRLRDTRGFDGREVVVVAEVDGEPLTLARDRRTLASAAAPDPALLELCARCQDELPGGWQLCGVVTCDAEARTIVIGTSLWNARGECLAWDATIEWLELLDLRAPVILGRGIFDDAALRRLATSPAITGGPGYVVRAAEGFALADHRRRVAHFVAGR